MLTAGQQVMVALMIAASIAAWACASGPRDAAPRDAAVGDADTVTLAVEGMT